MEQQKLVEIASKNETSKKVFESLYSRKRNTQYTQLGSMRNEIRRKTGFNVNMSEFNQCFTALEHAGMCKTEYGERGTLKGVYWTNPKGERVEPREVGRLGLNLPEPKPVDKPQVTEAPKSLRRGPITVIILRPGEKSEKVFESPSAAPDEIREIVKQHLA